ncbi:MAG: hypothetical protein JW839_06540, partial [Candidatus Lokiarchaeota archaeon]|nr:hypothetical protein [Candidatus Lokiarchaeota archaeon]
MIATSCILLGSMHVLAFQAGTMQPVIDTFGNGSIAQPSSLYERSTDVEWDGWSDYPDDDCAQAVAVSGRDVYMAGYANKGIGLQYDAYLAKYDAELRRVWNVSWGGAGNEKAYGVAVSGNYVYITGSTTNSSTGDLNMFVNKYATNGTLMWNSNFSAGTPGADKSGYAIAASNDAVYVAGYDGTNHMVWKYYQNGVQDWYDSTTINASSCATGIAVSGGWVYTVGYSHHQAPSSNQLFLRSIDFNQTSGSLYVKPLGSVDDERGYGIAVKDGYVYVTGRSGMIGAYSSYQALVMRLSTNFVVNWTRYWDEPGSSNRWETGLGIALKYDYVLFTGFSKDTSGAPSYVGQYILAGYWTNGTSAFNKSFGIPGFYDDEFRGIAAGQNCMYVAGGYSHDAPYYTKFDTRIYKFSAITHPDDQSFACGTTGHQLAWTLYTGAGSPTEHNYTIYRNGTQVHTSQWAASPSGYYFEHNIDGLPVGVHNYTIIAGLIDGDVVQDTTYVTISNVDPVLSMPATAAVELNTSGNELSCTVNDLSTGSTNYTLYRNGSFLLSDTWAHGVPITWDVDGLGIGTYNYTIFVDDGLGSIESGSTILNVSNWPPMVTMPASVAIDGNTGGNVLSCTIVDHSTGAAMTYVVYRNGIPVQSGFWMSSMIVVWDADGLGAGSYNFTVVASDGLGSSGSGTTIAT